jgi:peptidyl-prolyl cis-trans isomerase SurA
MSNRLMKAPESIRYPISALCRLACAAAIALALLAAVPRPAAAQVVALVNGAPITEIDISQRMKFIQLSTHKSATRKEALQALVDDHLKVFISKRYSVGASDQDVDNAFANMAQRSHLTPKQMEEQLARGGLSLSTLKFKLRADLGWSNLIRGKFGSSLQISDADIRSAVKNDADKETSESKIYTLYPIIFVAPAGAPEGARRNEAENLRSRFNSCDDGLKLARVLRGVVVREPVKQNSGALAAPLREMLDKMDIGHLTVPEVTPQGVQMFALCGRDDSGSDSAAKRAAREAIFSKRYNAESKKYLEEVRRQSMIEYR